jgi:hypothetical protein
MLTFLAMLAPVSTAAPVADIAGEACGLNGSAAHITDSPLVDDWLVFPPNTPVTCSPVANLLPVFGTAGAVPGVRLANGLISRAFTTAPNWGTFEYVSNLESTGKLGVEYRVAPFRVETWTATVQFILFSHQQLPPRSQLLWCRVHQSIEVGPANIMRAFRPEAIVSIDGIDYPVGGVYQHQPPQPNEPPVTSTPFLNLSVIADHGLDTDASSFRYRTHSISAPVAPFEWTPGARGSPTGQQWPRSVFWGCADPNQLFVV